MVVHKLVLPDALRGRAWVFGDDVDTDQIIPAEFLVTTDEKELGKHIFEKVRPGFSKLVRRGDFIVAGENFGCGSSREHAVRALRGCGIAAVIAKSFGRIFYRNAVNLGFLVVECPSIDAKEGEELELRFKDGQILNLSSGKVFSFTKPSEFHLKLLECGGLIPYVKLCEAKQKRSER